VDVSWARGISPRSGKVNLLVRSNSWKRQAVPHRLPKGRLNVLVDTTGSRSWATVPMTKRRCYDTILERGGESVIPPRKPCFGTRKTLAPKPCRTDAGGRTWNDERGITA
jgi:hypothetical protein